jgi:hypothetical protein
MKADDRKDLTEPEEPFFGDFRPSFPASRPQENRRALVWVPLIVSAVFLAAIAMMMFEYSIARG